MFGTKHIIIMILSLLLVIGLYIFSKKLPFRKVSKIMFYVGVVSETIKVFFYIIQNEDTYGGVLPKTDLPFQLCSIQILLVAMVVFAKNEKLKKFILSFMYPSCLFGGIFAILIPTYSSLHYLPITFQYNLYHIAIIVYALNICTSKEISLTIKDYFNCLKCLVIVMFFAIYINSIIYDGVSNINFMYVVNPPVSGLPFLNKNHGWLVYICHYAVLVLTCVTLCYIHTIIRAIKDRINTRKAISVSDKTTEAIAVTAEMKETEKTTNHSK